MGEQRGAFFHVAECINNRRDGDGVYRTDDGRAESPNWTRTDSDGRRLTMMEPFAARRKARGKGIERGRHRPTSLPPSIPPTRNAAHPEKWSCGQSPERGRRGRAVWLLFSGFVRYSKAAEVIQSTIFRQISMTSSPPRGHATSTVREMRLASAE